MKNFEEMVNLAKQAKAPENAANGIADALANLPERRTAADMLDAGVLSAEGIEAGGGARTASTVATGAQTQTERTTEGAKNSARIIRPWWRRAGFAAAGVAACAAVVGCLVALPGIQEGSGDAVGSSPSAAAASSAAGGIFGNAFTVQPAYALELAPGQVAGNSTFAMTSQDTAEMGEDGCFTGLLFKVEGDNIAKVGASISKGELYRMTRTQMSKADFDGRWPKGIGDSSEGRVHMTTWEGEGVGNAEELVTDDYCEAIGASFEEGYDAGASYGFYQPASMLDSLATDPDDPKGPFWNLVDSFDGAVLDVTVTYDDGATETQSYELKAAKLKVAFRDEDAGFDLTQETTDGENDPFIYGLLANPRA